MGSQLGVVKVAAKQLGLTLEEYLANRDAGLKWCIKCETWKKTTAFAADRSRGDGLTSACKTCRNIRKTTGPGKGERQQQAKKGLSWCRLCQNWLPVSEVRQGLCRLHAAQVARERYVTDERHRAERRQHAHSRKRNIDVIPVDVQQKLLTFFGGRCAYCGKPPTTWDHVVPVSRGGTSSIDNVVPACGKCNSSKKAQDVHVWLKRTCRTPCFEFFARKCRE